MGKLRVKYLLSVVVVLLFVQFIFGLPAAPTMLGAHHAAEQQPDSLRRDSIRQAREIRRVTDSLLNVTGMDYDSLATLGDTIVQRRKSGAGLDRIITGHAVDSLYYDMRKKMVYMYEQGEVKYDNMNLQADFMNIDLDSKNIYAYGKADTINGEPTVTRPLFTQGGTSLNMDTIAYNIESQRAKIKGIATQQGDGWLIGQEVKKMEDNSIHIADGMYTTCDHTDHPHFYYYMSKAKVIPGDNGKVIMGGGHLVIEDVDIPFLGLPEGFFPLSSGPKSGFLMPTYGEEARRGFYMRGMGYYFTLSDYMDLALTGGFYTLGSWEAQAVSRYTKRYKYSGSINLNYASIRSGDKEDPDYINQNTFRVQWTHSQDAKANPGSTFSASVNLSSSGYSRYSATTLNDMLATQTNSSIAYAKNWAGTPFSLSMNLGVSQNSQTQALSVTLPTVAFNVSKFFPLKRKVKLGSDRWYEKISMSYSAKLTNNVQTTESEIFTPETLKNMRNGVQHNIPVQASFNLLNYINVTPNMNYSERWYFKKVDKQWNPETNQVENLAPEYGFYRLYDYNAGVSMSTTVYGQWQVREKYKELKLQAIRHTATPSISFSYAPDFGNQKYGYFKTVQADSTGRTLIYSPFTDNAYGIPSSGRNMALSFNLSQSLEAKVLSKRDSTGVSKIKIIDDFSIGGSYNFLADSMKLSTISLSLRSSLSKKLGINLRATLDPYEVTPEGKRYDKLTWSRGNLGRILNTGWSFGYSFQSRKSSTPAINDINSIPPEYTNPFYDPYGQMDPYLRRQYMSQAYYDFSLPWNFGFNYSVNYNLSYVNNGTTGYKRNVTQTIGFNGSLTISPKMSITVNGGYDISANKLTTSSINISRDLHCWQMSFSWVPFGHYKSWSFHIGVKAGSLQDLKYEKSQSMYDNYY
ncbi:MAG: LPS-assembly protein LptD [Alistipes sp.]|nr:LPS-assembly protein LptD [Alistipes sp.]